MPNDQEFFGLHFSKYHCFWNRFSVEFFLWIFFKMRQLWRIVQNKKRVIPKPHVLLINLKIKPSLISSSTFKFSFMLRRASTRKKNFSYRLTFWPWPAQKSNKQIVVLFFCQIHLFFLFEIFFAFNHLFFFNLPSFLP